MKFFHILLIFTLLSIPAFTQNIGIGTASPNASAMLDVSSANKGMLVPRVSLISLADGSTISNPATSLLVYNTNATLSGGVGFYYNSGTTVSPAWTPVATGKSAWMLGGNAGTDPGVNFIGTSDLQPLVFKVNNQQAGYIYSSNVAMGYQSFIANSSGFSSSAFGYKSLEKNTTGYQNTAIGYLAMQDNLGGTSNVALGNSALGNNTSGNENCAVGILALNKNTIKSGLVAIGVQALYNNGLNSTSSLHGSYNTAVGSRSLYANTTGNRNTATGFESLNANTTGFANTANGYLSMTATTIGYWNSAYGVQSLENNSSGQANNALGFEALSSNSNGDDNTAIGTSALRSNVSGNSNVGVGSYALLQNTGSSNTGLGRNALYSNTSGTNNTAVGALANVSTGALTNATAVGYGAGVGSSNAMVFGNTLVTKWGFGRNVTTGVLQVGDDGTNGNGAYLSAGGNWVNTSDAFKKENFQPLDGELLLNKIMQLDITRWNYKGTSQKTTHIGPMAQDFKRLFDVGEDNVSISTIDPSGIALRAIQELNMQNKKLRIENHQLSELVKEMNERLQILEELIIEGKKK